MISSYYCFEKLSEDIRSLNGIRSKTRLDCTMAYIGKEKPFDLLVNHKNQMFVYPSEPEEVVKADKRRQGIVNLTNGKNFSAIFIPDLDYKNYGFGDYNSDALLFIMNDELSKIEMLVFSGLRHYAKTLFQKLLDNGFDSEIEDLRKKATEFYKYKMIA